MLDKIILGLLQLGNHTAYSLQKAMEQSTGHFYGASQGSINPALKKLADYGAIDGKPLSEGKRKRIEYAITEVGQRTFDEWVNSAMTVGRVRDNALVRLFFLGHVSPAERKQRIEEFCSELRDEYQALEAILQATHQNLQGRALTEVETFRLETLRFGRDYYAFSVQWYEDLLKRENKLQP